MNAWIERLYSDADLLRMGHAQRAEDRNLGLGWLYYAVVRIVRPSTVVVIGSYRGFSPMVFGKAVADNSEGGRVVFIDPGLVDGFWKNPDAVRAHFASYGVHNVDHHSLTTQQFVETEAYRAMGEVGVVFVDGYHSEEQARFDFEAFEPLLAPNAIVLFHDSARVRVSRIYGPDRPYEHRVRDLMDKFKAMPEWQVFDFPFGDGVTLVRRDVLP